MTEPIYWSVTCDKGLIVDALKVSYRESSSGITDITVLTDTAAVGDAIQLHYHWSQGANSNTELVFSGVIDHIVDLQDGRKVLQCTENLQQAADALYRAQIDNLFAAAETQWHHALSSPTATGWDYLQHRITTYPGSVQIRNGAVTLIPWAAGAMPDPALVFIWSENKPRQSEVYDTIQLTVDYHFQRIIQLNAEVYFARSRGNISTPEQAKDLFTPEDFLNLSGDHGNWRMAAADGILMRLNTDETQILTQETLLKFTRDVPELGHLANTYKTRSGVNWAALVNRYVRWFNLHFINRFLQPIQIKGQINVSTAAGLRVKRKAVGYNQEITIIDREELNAEANQLYNHMTPAEIAAEYSFTSLDPNTGELINPPNQTERRNYYLRVSNLDILPVDWQIPEPFASHTYRTLPWRNRFILWHRAVQAQAYVELEAAQREHCVIYQVPMNPSLRAGGAILAVEHDFSPASGQAVSIVTETLRQSPAMNLVPVALSGSIAAPEPPFTSSWFSPMQNKAQMQWVVQATRLGENGEFLDITETDPEINELRVLHLLDDNGEKNEKTRRSLNLTLPEFDVPLRTLTIIPGTQDNDSSTVIYTVTFKDWDGITLKTEAVTAGSDATPPPIPERPGHTFTGWAVVIEDAGSYAGDYTNVTEDRTLMTVYDETP